ncbi:ASCH domain-containing protein [Paraburkholderia youngii]|uniref:ASCH domain-containing protein n=1 Tax=Paraburkholderia youngii TaxID=2782701 RepID=UPI003D1FDA40
MKALSIRQGWAWLCAQGQKDIENRTWNTKFRGQFLIHASASMTRAGYDECFSSAMTIGIGGRYLPRFEDMERGGIVGVATLVAVVPPEQRTSPWHVPGLIGFQLADASPLPFIPCKGALQFFTVPDDVAATAGSLLSRIAA